MLAESGRMLRTLQSSIARQDTDGLGALAASATSLQTRADDLSFAPVQRTAGASGLSGAVQLTQEAGELKIASEWEPRKAGIKYATSARISHTR
jgi:uncharacterized protein YhdP